jgi:hypothetical protein
MIGMLLISSNSREMAEREAIVKGYAGKAAFTQSQINK